MMLSSDIGRCSFLCFLFHGIRYQICKKSQNPENSETEAKDDILMLINFLKEFCRKSPFVIIPGWRIFKDNDNLLAIHVPLLPCLSDFSNGLFLDKRGFGCIKWVFGCVLWNRQNLSWMVQLIHLKDYFNKQKHSWTEIYFTCNQNISVSVDKNEYPHPIIQETIFLIQTKQENKMPTLFKKVMQLPRNE